MRTEPDMEPEWLIVLREECAATSQVSVGKRIGYSSGLISSVLKGTYEGNLNNVKDAVEGALLGAKVDCPILGELLRNRCLGYQRRRFASTNPTRVALSSACPSCPHRRAKETA